jgi:hypothetical protein
MNFKTHNDGIVCTSGGWLQGYIEITYKELKAKLGKPTIGDEYKTDAEWEIKFEDGTETWIYNYKNGKNYNGSSGIPKTKITKWNIGGSTEKSKELIHKLFNYSEKENKNNI